MELQRYLSEEIENKKIDIAKWDYLCAVINKYSKEEREDANENSKKRLLRS